MRKASSFACCLSVILLYGCIQQQAATPFPDLSDGVTSKKLLQICNADDDFSVSYCYAYIRGVSEGVPFGRAVAGGHMDKECIVISPKLRGYWIPEYATNAHVVDSVVWALETYGDRLPSAALVAIPIALGLTFPCRGAQPIQRGDTPSEALLNYLDRSTKLMRDFAASP